MPRNELGNNKSVRCRFKTTQPAPQTQSRTAVLSCRYRLINRMARKRARTSAGSPAASSPASKGSASLTGVAVPADEVGVGVATGGEAATEELEQQEAQEEEEKGGEGESDSSEQEDDDEDGE